MLNDLVNVLINESIDKEHSEKLAEVFFKELDDSFKMPTVGYAIFIILAQTYDMLEAQDEKSALFFKGLMMDCVRGLGEMNE